MVLSDQNLRLGRVNIRCLLESIGFYIVFCGSLNYETVSMFLPSAFLKFVLCVGNDTVENEKVLERMDRFCWSSFKCSSVSCRKWEKVQEGGVGFR